MEEKKWSWEHKIADYSVEIPDTYGGFSGKIKATCSLGGSTDIYHIRFERVNYRGGTVVNDIYLNNDEMRVVKDFAERLSDKKLVEEKELERVEKRVREEGKSDVDTFMEFLRGHSLVKDVHFYRGDGEREIIIKLS